MAWNWRHDGMGGGDGKGMAERGEPGGKVEVERRVSVEVLGRVCSADMRTRWEGMGCEVCI